MTVKLETSNRVRKWLIIGGGLLLVLVVGWFILTSGPVVRALVLPRVAAALHGDLAVGEVSLSPFSGIDLKNLKFTPGGGQPLAEIAVVKVRYQLFKLIRGEIAIDEVELDQPRITIRQRIDGGSELADWLAKLNSESAKTAGTPKPAGPSKLQIGKVTIRDGAARYEIAKANGSKDVLALDGLKFEVDQVSNSAASTIKLGAGLRLETLAADGKIVEALRAAADFSGKVTLDAGLLPGNFDARLKIGFTEATGRFAQANGLGAMLNARGSIKQLDDVTLSFQRGADETGRVQVTGGYDQAAGNGAFDIRVSKLPPVVLAIAALKSGLDFDLVDFSATNRLAISQGGRLINALGGWEVKGFAAKNKSGTTPTLDVSLNFDTEIEATASRAAIKSLALVTRQNGQPLIDVRAARPFRFVWNGQPGSEAGSSIALNITSLRLRDWRPFLGDLPIDGVVAAQAGIEAKELGQRLSVTAQASLEQGQLAVGTNRIDALSAALNLQGELDSFRSLQLSQLNLGLKRSGTPVAGLAVTGRVGFSNLTASLQTTLTGELVPLAGLLSELPLTTASGTVAVTSTLDYSVLATVVKGAASVTNLTVDLQGAKFNRAKLHVPFEVSLNGSFLNWKLRDVSVSEGGATALAMDSTGQLELKAQTGAIEFALPVITERLVNPFLAAHVPQQRLRSAQAALSAKGELLAGGRQRWSLISQSTNVVLVGSNNIPLGPALGSHAALSVEVNTGRGEVSLKQWVAHLFADGRACGDLVAAGEIRMHDGVAKLNAKLSGVNEHALRPFAPLLIGERIVEQANLTAELDLDYDATRASKVRGQVDLRDFKVRDPAGPLADSTRELGLMLNASIASNRVDVKEGWLQLTPSVGFSNRLELVGWADVSNPGAIRGDLVIRSSGLDLTPIYVLLERRGSPTQVPGAVDLAPERAGAAKTGDSLPTLPFSRLDLAVDVRRLKLRELIASNWLATATVYSNSVNLGRLSLRLNDSPINARMMATNAAGRARFELAAETEGLRFAPIIRTFYPDWQGLAEADLFSAIHVNGTARPGQSLWSAAVGDIYVGVTNANVALMSTRWQKALRPVGVLLRTPELFSSPISWALHRSQLTNQTIELKQLTLISDAYVLDASARIPLADDFVSSVIPRTPINLYLSRSLISQLSGSKGAETNRTLRYVQLPVFAHVSGTIGEPKVETDKLKLTGLAVGSVGGMVGGAAGDVLQSAGGITEAIGGIVSGRKILGGEKGDANVVSKGIEGIFDLVGGVVGGTGKAVDKGTGAVTGTKAVEPDVLAARVAAFDWPRVFTNAPNSRPLSR